VVCKVCIALTAVRWTSRLSNLHERPVVFVHKEVVFVMYLCLYLYLMSLSVKVVSICTSKQDKTVVRLSTFILMYFHESENVLYMSLYRKVVFVRKD